MSGNINDTNANVINEQINGLKSRLRELNDNGEKKNDYEKTLQREFKKLYKTSKTLFNYIFNNYNTSKFNEDFFNKTIGTMLGKIRSIQSSEITQEHASNQIGGLLAKKYIPQLK